MPQNSYIQEFSDVSHVNTPLSGSSEETLFTLKTPITKPSKPLYLKKSDGNIYEVSGAQGAQGSSGGVANATADIQSTAVTRTTISLHAVYDGHAPVSTYAWSIESAWSTGTGQSAAFSPAPGNSPNATISNLASVTITSVMVRCRITYSDGSIADAYFFGVLSVNT